MKRRIFTFLTMAICIAFLPVEYVMATEYTDSSGLVYNLDEENQTATVSDCDGSVTTVTIPSTITADEIVYTITGIGGNAFFYCNSLVSLELPESVTSIGTFAFSNCNSLTSLKLPESVTSIGSSAFYMCTSLKSIVIPSGVKSIESSTFFHCGNLEMVTIPDGVTSIGISAFAGCKNLTNIHLSKNVTSIGSNAFGSCNKLEIRVAADNPNYVVEDNVLYDKEKTTLMVAPKASGDFHVLDGVTVIDGYAFANCKQLTSVILPDSVTSVGVGVFDGCSSLTDVDFSENWTEIAAYTFQNCINLKNIHIPESVTGIGPTAFYGCQALECLIIPDSVTEMYGIQMGNNNQLQPVYCPMRLIEQWKNVGNEHLTFDELCDVNTLVGYEIQEDGTVSLTVERYPEGITELLLPNEICGKKVSSIKSGENADIEVSCVSHDKDNLTYDAKNHWYTCTVCGGTKEIAHIYPGGNDACECGYVPFISNVSERKIHYELGYSEKTELSVSVVPTLGTETITYKWYENESEIAGENKASYFVPTGKTMGTYSYTCKVSCGAYRQEYKIATLIVNPDIKQKGEQFKDTKKKAVYKVTATGKLNETTGSVTGATVQYVKPVSAKKSTVTIPSTIIVDGVTYKVTSIAKNAFKNNKYIKKLTIGSNIKTIGANAFYNCKKLKTVKLGKDVTTIGKQAFYKCKKLKIITIRSKKLKTSKIGKNAWKGIKSNATIKVPKKKYKDYKKMMKKRGVSNSARFKKI